MREGQNLVRGSTAGPLPYAACGLASAEARGRVASATSAVVREAEGGETVLKVEVG